MKTFMVSEFREEGQCERSRKRGEVFLVSCPELGYENKPMSPATFKEEVRFHSQGVADGLTEDVLDVVLPDEHISA